jgi:hypothetical protein
LLTGEIHEYWLVAEVGLSAPIRVFGCRCSSQMFSLRVCRHQPAMMGRLAKLEPGHRFTVTYESVHMVPTMRMSNGDRSVSEAAPSDVHRHDSVESNARLTATVAAVLLVLLAAEGITIQRVRSLLTPHVFIGVLLMPPVALKTLSTGYRLVRYYTGDPAYRRKGPPPAALRLLGPCVVVLTATVLASGVTLLFAGSSWRARMLEIHKASFVLWFGAMPIHVLGHLADTAKFAPRDWLHRSRRQVAGAGLRQWAMAASLVGGCLLAVAVLGRVDRG